jgi:hydrophobic/amphiphilic exporter-1 (mainly G- bacteria), HAE1 family
MGGVVIGGMLGSIFFTYFMVPAVHRLIYKVKSGIGKFAAGALSLKEN